MITLFAKNLKRWRDERRLTQRDLANKSGIEQAMVSRLESGDRHPSLTTIIALAKALKVEPSDLLRTP